MPGNVRPVTDERDGLLSYLAQQRLVLRLTAFGLTDDQARATPTVSSLCVGGLIKHVVSVERFWMDVVLLRPEPRSPDDYFAAFRLNPDETLAGVLEAYADTAAETEKIVADIADLGQPVPVPQGPWFPSDVEAWSVRWVLLHLIQETARHAGHGDIIRETIDGATGFALMAAAEGWPQTPWLKPWTPPAEVSPSDGTPSRNEISGPSAQV
jgi:uncharacterized damage-inducible protein DinB